MTVVVIGGGVIGLCTSLALAKRGLKVTLIEAARPGSGASVANAGWVVPSFSGPLPAPGLLGTSLRWLLRSDSPLWIRPRLDRAFARWLFTFWRRMTWRNYRAGLEATLDLSRSTMSLFDELARSGLRFEMRTSGVVMAYSSAKTLDTGLHDAGALAAFGYAPVHLTTGNAVRDLEPSLGDGIMGAFVVEGERYVDPVSFCSAVLGELGRLGVQILAPGPVTRFLVQRARVAGVQAASSTVSADSVVIAAGVGSATLAAELGVPLPIESGKGYALDLAPSPLRLRRPVYLHDQRIAVTPLSDRLRLAGTMELGARSDSISMARVRAIESNARRLLVGWSDAPVSKTYLSGLRPLTPDGLPVIGPLPGLENVWVASGHAMLGLTLAPATAEAVADGIISGVVPTVIRPFLPDRFTRPRHGGNGVPAGRTAPRLTPLRPNSAVDSKDVAPPPTAESER
jgi:D-amino-acid dehydrogenase